MHPLSWLLGVWKSFYHHWKDLLELHAKSSMKYSFYQSPLCQQQNKRTLISSDDEDIQWENGTANVTLEGLVWLADYSLYWGGFFGPWIFSHVSGNKNERLSFLENNLPYTNLHIRELDHRIPLSLARLRFTVRLLDAHAKCKPPDPSRASVWLWREFGSYEYPSIGYSFRINKGDQFCTKSHNVGRNQNPRGESLCAPQPRREEKIIQASPPPHNCWILHFPL